MNMKRKAKKFATILQLMVGATLLTSCGKENINTSDNEITSAYEIDNTKIDNSGIQVFESDILENISISDYKEDIELSEELYSEINKELQKSKYTSLNIKLDFTPINFTNIDISKFTKLTIDCSNVLFDYTPFYNKNYEYLKLTISENTNKDSIINFLQNINIEDYLYLDFTEDVSKDLINEYLNIISTKRYNNFSIVTSANINELVLDKINSNYLSILHKTDSDLDYKIVLNDSVKEFAINTCYPENFKETVSLANLEVISKNEELSINFRTFLENTLIDETVSVNVDNKTKIKLPNNCRFEVCALNTNKADDDWFKQFDNTFSTNIKSSDNNSYFNYNRSEKTIEEAIEEMRFSVLENEILTYLKEYEIDIRRYEQVLFFEANKQSDIIIDDDKLYDYINSAIKKYNINRIVIEKLEKQIDFEKIDLSNISSIDLSDVGYNFEYKAFVKNNKEKPPSNILTIKVKKDNNHVNRLNYLKSIPLAENAYVDLNIGEGVDLETATSYINALDLSKVLHLSIDYDKLNELDLTNLNVPILDLFTDYNKEIIDYSININSEVEQLVLCFYYDHEYQKIPFLNEVKVNSSNTNLTTRLMVLEGIGYEKFNCKVDNSSTISVPDCSTLYVIGVEESSITKEFLEQFKDLNGFLVTNNMHDYQYQYTENQWSYYYKEKKQEKELLMELKF